VQDNVTNLQLSTRKQSYFFTGLKGFLEQIGTVLVIIISHNIGQIIDADCIYVLEQGRVAQSGSPEEVYRQGGRYKEIFDASARSMNAGKIANVINEE